MFASKNIVLLYTQHIYSERQVWVKSIEIPIEVWLLMLDTVLEEVR